MGVGTIDILVFVIFVAAVIGVRLWKSRGEEIDGEHGARDCFLRGRGLTWWLVGFTLIAAKISTEQFVGMSGKAADWLGMAISTLIIGGAILAVLALMTLLKPLPQPVTLPINEGMDMRTDVRTKVFGAAVILLTLTLYAIFW